MPHGEPGAAQLVLPALITKAEALEPAKLSSIWISRTTLSPWANIFTLAGLTVTVDGEGIERKGERAERLNRVNARSWDIKIDRRRSTFTKICLREKKCL
jgi:hypothetical protein